MNIHSHDVGFLCDLKYPVAGSLCPGGICLPGSFILRAGAVGSRSSRAASCSRAAARKAQRSHNKDACYSFSEHNIFLLDGAQFYI